MPDRTIAQQILADWRAAERDLAAADRGGAERVRLERQIARLRHEYQRLLDEAARNMQPDLPACPTCPEQQRDIAEPVGLSGGT